jgi:hypothetical protein
MKANKRKQDTLSNNSKTWNNLEIGAARKPKNQEDIQSHAISTEYHQTSRSNPEEAIQK